jgi:oligopeptide/dipeptide ABC transporter, ATP-binding protein, C-terminal domain
MLSPDQTILSVDALNRTFTTSKLLPWQKSHRVHAVSDVSFSVRRGEIVGVVGESGSGKTTLGRMILKLTNPDSGRVAFQGQDIADVKGHDLTTFRRRMQVVFQDPYSSLNPRQQISQILTEPLVIHGLARGRRSERVLELLSLVDLPPSAANRYPHEFSGGQRQRIGIARALALEPDFIVADEPVSALDVSIQAQITALLERLQRQLGLSMLIIAHDLALVQHISHRIIVMYLGKVMEILPSDDLTTPHHPYTLALLSAAPRIRTQNRMTKLMLKGDIPSPANPPSGCVFRTRCPFSIDACGAAVPQLRTVGRDHLSACIRTDLVRDKSSAWAPGNAAQENRINMEKGPL